MSSSANFVRQSLDLHLFFARIMKEHSFFLQASFTPRDKSLAQQADMFRQNFDKLLADAVALANGVVSNSVLQSGEIVTPYTIQAENATSFLTGVNIPTNITKAETKLVGDGKHCIDPKLEQRVSNLNQRAIELLPALIEFKKKILEDVLRCKLFTFNYPLLIDHIMREAILYLRMIQRIQNHEHINIEKEAYEQEAFWNRIMAEHCLFIRGLLDPTENKLIDAANNFAGEFNKLTKEAINALEKSLPLKGVTAKSLEATKELREFKRQGTEGLLECKIRSIIIPLLGDHVLREANHFLRLLKKYEKTVRAT